MPSVATCRHHWLIDTANGPTSEGECKNCRERRTFKNSAPPERTLTGKGAIEGIAAQEWPLSRRKEER